MKICMWCKLLVPCCWLTAYGFRPGQFASSLHRQPTTQSPRFTPKNPARLRRYTELAFTRVRGLAITNPDRLGRHLVAERVAWLDCHYGRGGRSGLGRVPDVDGANRRKARGASRVWLLHPVRCIEHRPRDHGGSERPEHTPGRSSRCCSAASYCPASCSALPAKAPSAVRSVRRSRRPDAAIGTHWSIQSKASVRFRRHCQSNEVLSFQIGLCGYRDIGQLSRV